jgi:hypothetical protein
MGLRIITAKEAAMAEMFELKEDVYLDKSRKKIVKETDPEVDVFLGAKGHRIPMEQAVELGLTKGKKSEEPGEDKSEEPGEDKSVKKGGKK